MLGVDTISNSQIARLPSTGSAQAILVPRPNFYGVEVKNRPGQFTERMQDAQPDMPLSLLLRE